VVHAELADDEAQRVLDLSPRIEDLFQLHQLYYHVQPTFFTDGDLGQHRPPWAR
jgi:hypothetical protein